jgi:phenylalanyl-tRNA synthetase beta chain
VDFCANDNPIALANPIAENLNVMRSSLVGSLVDCLRFNLTHQQERVRLFEIGRCFARDGTTCKQTMMLGGIAYGGALSEQWGATLRNVDFYDVKYDLEALAGTQGTRFAAFQHPALHPGRAAQMTVHGLPAGWLGELHPRLQQKYDLPLSSMVFELNLDLIKGRRLAHYREYSQQPAVRRDISVEVAENVSAQSMLKALKTGAPSIVSEVAIFDVYRGKGIDSDKKSVAFKVLLQDTHKTLTDAEAEAAIQQLLHVLQEDFRAKLRK